MSSGAPVTTACHCRGNVFSVVPISPRARHACHCAACRKSTGAPFTTHVQVQHPLFPPGRLPGTISAYATSARGTRYFCSTCGAHVGVRADIGEGLWFVTTGTMERVDGLFELRWHEQVADTGDGGITRVLKDDLDRWSTAIGLEKFEQPDSLAKFKGKSESEDVLKASCRCAGVKVEIKRPASIPDGPNAKEIGSADGRRWLGGHCFCSDCRLTSGFPLVSWITVGNEHLSITGESLQMYESSPGVKRGFCRRCGASVSFERAGKGCVEVPVALFDVDVERGEGVAAVEAEWLEWESELGFPNDGREKDLVVALARGSKGE